MMRKHTAAAAATAFILFTWFGAQRIQAQIDQPYTFEVAAPAAVGYDLETGIASFDATFSVHEDAANDGFPNQTQGFSLSVKHDPLEITPTQMDAVGELLAMGLSSEGPAFWGEILSATSADGDVGATLGVIYDFLGNVTLTFDVSKEIVKISYETVPGAWAGNDAGGSTSLDFDTLSIPPVANVVVTGGIAYDVAFVNATIALEPVVPVLFVRGDCNDDSHLNIADGIFILNNLFQDGAAGPCIASCNTNGDSLLDQSDAISIFNYAFLDGPAPPAPFPDCGPAPDSIPCEAFTGCL